MPTTPVANKSVTDEPCFRALMHMHIYIKPNILTPIPKKRKTFGLYSDGMETTYSYKNSRVIEELI